MDKGCIMEKELPFIFLCLLFGTCEVVFNKGIEGLVFFSLFSFSVFCQTGKHL